MKFHANSQYELMFKVAAVIKVEDFPQGGVSYFTLDQIAAGEYELVRGEKTYFEEMQFFREVASKLASRIIYGAITYLNDERPLLLGIRGISEVCEFEIIDGKWALYDYDNWAVREESIALRRFKISNDWQALKKALA